MAAASSPRGGGRREALLLRMDALNALKQVTLEEPIAGVTYGRPSNPR